MNGGKTQDGETLNIPHKNINGVYSFELDDIELGEDELVISNIKD